MAGLLDYFPPVLAAASEYDFTAHGDVIWKLAFGPGGKVFATAADGTLRIWDAAKLEPKKE